MVKEVNKEHKNVEMTRKKKRSGIVYFDYSLLAILICLVCFGLVMLYSTSSYSAMMKQNGDSLFYFKRQLLFCIVGWHASPQKIKAVLENCLYSNETSLKLFRPICCEFPSAFCRFYPYRRLYRFPNKFRSRYFPC